MITLHQWLPYRGENTQYGREILVNISLARSVYSINYVGEGKVLETYSQIYFDGEDYVSVTETIEEIRKFL